MLKDKKVIKFNTPYEMFDYVYNNCDLYNLETGDYVFRYSEAGSFAVYNLSIEEAERLEQMATECNEYWGGMLGVGGYIYDDVTSDFYKKGDETNMSYCKEVYNQGVWLDVTH